MARIDLGIPASEVGSTLLHEFRDLFDRVREIRDLDDFRAGQVCAMVANANRDSKSCPRPFEASDFFPHLKRNKPAPSEVPADRVVEWFRAMASLASHNERSR